MKKTITILAAVAFSNFYNAQDMQNTTVEKSLTGVQIGFLGADLYNEARLSDKVALRSAISLNPAIWGGDIYPKTGFAFYPALSLQPKYYYNIEKRAKDGKNTNHNSANYLSLDVKYIPNWFVISNYDNISTRNILGVVPTWGLRRSFSENFNYEFNAGLGYGISFDKNSTTQSGLMLNLGFKIGYDF